MLKTVISFALFVAVKDRHTRVSVHTFATQGEHRLTWDPAFFLISGSNGKNNNITTPKTGGTFKKILSSIH